MPEDRVTITADAGQYFDVLSRAGVAADRLGASGTRVGEGFVRGERVVRTASANIAAALLTSGDAATTALIAMQGLERVFKIGILPTVAVAGAVALFEVFHRQIERTKEASSDLAKELGKSFDLQAQGSVDAITADIDKLTEAIKKLRKETTSKTSVVMSIIGTVGEREALKDVNKAFGKSPLTPLPESKEQKQLVDSEKRLRELATARADKEVEIAEAKRDENKESLSTLNYESQRSKLFQGAFRAGLNMVDLMKRLIALQINLNSEIAKEGNARQAAQRKSLETAGDFFADVGSGRFAERFREQQRQNEDIRRGQALIDEIREGQRRGFFQDPLSQAELRAAEKLGTKAQTGLSTLLNADFSNLKLLSEYDFSGLAPLNGLTIQVQ